MAKGKKKVAANEESIENALKNLSGFVQKGAKVGSVDKIPTGYFNLDFAINYGSRPEDFEVYGSKHKEYDPSKPLGIPTGRLVHLYGAEGSGKSYICYRMTGMAQKMGHKVAWIDTEQSFSEDLAIINGVDLDELLYSDLRNLEDPDKIFYAEDVMDNIVGLIKAGVKLIILDSVANLNPKSRMEAGAEQQYVALLARMLSDNLGKIVQWAGAKDALVVFINQLREKPGLMFGCFDYKSKVLLEDGTTRDIGYIVNNKLKEKVMSYNQKTGEIEPKNIIGWHNNGNLVGDERFYQFVVREMGGNGRVFFACTPNHKIFVPKKNRNYEDSILQAKDIEEITASDLKIGDKIAISQPMYLSEEQRQLVYGSILGDGSVRSMGEGSCSQLRIKHGSEQKDYCLWKKEIISPWVGYENEDKKGYGFDTIPMYELKSLNPHKNGSRGKTGAIASKEIINNINELGLAIWYLDDGTLDERSNKKGKNGKGRSSICCTKFENKDDIFSIFHRFGLNPTMGKTSFCFTQEETEKLHSIISPYVPECMGYKLLPQFRGKYDYKIECITQENIKYRPVVSEILDIYQKPINRSRVKFDLTIEDNGTYIIDGATVHNSPITTKGGRSLVHNSSLSMEVSKCPKTSKPWIFIEDERVPGGKRLIGRRSKIRFDKNRFSKPFVDQNGNPENVEIPIYYEPYFPDMEDVIFDIGRQQQIIRVYKGVFKWASEDGEIKCEQEGRDNFINEIKENEELKKALIKNITSKSEETGNPLPPEITQYDPDVIVKVVEATDEDDERAEKISKQKSKQKKQTEENFEENFEDQEDVLDV